MRTLTRLLVPLIIAATPAVAGAAEAAADSSPLLATVGDKTISAADFEQAANIAARQKFYHGQPPQGEVDALMREVAQTMIDRILLLEEVDRRAVEPDRQQVEAVVASYEARYKDSPMWQQHKDKLLPGLRTQLEQDSRVKRLEADVRRTPPPDEAAVLAYYKGHLDKFVEPEKLHLAMILLQVAPSSPAAVWTAAEDEAGRLVTKLRAGADFAELARLQSADESGRNGGDLGYLHRGMVPDGLQSSIDRMSPGEISPPIRVLQGITVFRLIERQPARQMDFAASRTRAGELLAREQRDQAWAAFLAGLRGRAHIELNTQRYPALATQGGSAK